jgi:hypothetical protein
MDDVEAVFVDPEHDTADAPGQAAFGVVVVPDDENKPVNSTPCPAEPAPAQAATLPERLKLPRESRRRPHTGSFLQMIQAMPSTEAVKREKLVHSSLLSNVTWERVRQLLEADDDCIFFGLVEQGLQAWNITGTSWADATSAPGTQVRKIQFQMKLPTDIPAAIKRLVSIPDDSRVNNLFHLGITDQKAMVLREIQSLDAPFGTHFWASEVLVFTPQQTGVKFEMWCNMRWVASLPWYASPISSIIEQTCVDGGKESGATLAKLLQCDIE